MKIKKQQIARCQHCGALQALRDGIEILRIDRYTLCCNSPEYFIQGSKYDKFNISKLLRDSVLVSVNPRNARWQCSGCDNLCALLTPPNIVPTKYTCPIDNNLDANWRQIS